MRLVEVRLRDLPEVVPDEDHGRGYVRVGGWCLDPSDEDGTPEAALKNAKAWAAYSYWLQTK